MLWNYAIIEYHQLMVLYRYAIAHANEYLVLTGAGIEDLRICKKAIVMPWQRVCLSSLYSTSK